MIEFNKEEPIYKYYPVNEFLYSTLINNEIWLSKPERFNDPFDCNLKEEDIKMKSEINRTRNLLSDIANSNVQFIRFQYGDMRRGLESL